MSNKRYAGINIFVERSFRYIFYIKQKENELITHLITNSLKLVLSIKHIKH